MPHIYIHTCTHHTHTHTHIYIPLSHTYTIPNTHTPIFRLLCVDVNAHPVYCTLAEILNSEENLTFASLMVQVLNMILFTSAELYELRTQLKDLHSTVSDPAVLLSTELHCNVVYHSVPLLSTPPSIVTTFPLSSQSPPYCSTPLSSPPYCYTPLSLPLAPLQEDWCLFKTLYQCWCHNPVTTLALCLLSQNYEHSSHLICKFTDLEITAGFLKELDKLVQLLESPIFAFLRLQILEPHQNPHLLQTLYGVLMLLPQTTAFETLRQRLSCVPVMTLIHMNDKPTR